MFVDVGVQQALPSADITMNADQVNKALYKRTSATHSITHAMAYLANYTLNYTLTASTALASSELRLPAEAQLFGRATTH